MAAALYPPVAVMVALPTVSTQLWMVRNGLHAALDGAVELEEDILEVPDIDTGEGLRGAASFHSGFGGLMFNGLVHTGKRKRSTKNSQYIISSSSLPFLYCHIPY